MTHLRIAAALAVAAAVQAAAAAPAKAQPGPLEVTRLFYAALHRGRADAAARHVAPATRPALRPFVRIAQAHRDVEAAVAARFGRAEAARVGYGDRVQAEVKALLGAQERVVDGRALVLAADGSMVATLRRIGGAWKVELDDELATADGQARIEREAAAASKAARRVASGIRAGRYADAAAAVRDFQEEIARAGPPAREDRRGDGGVDL